MKLPKRVLWTLFFTTIILLFLLTYSQKLAVNTAEQYQSGNVKVTYTAPNIFQITKLPERLMLWDSTYSDIESLKAEFGGQVFLSIHPLWHNQVRSGSQARIDQLIAMGGYVVSTEELFISGYPAIRVCIYTWMEQVYGFPTDYVYIDSVIVFVEKNDVGITMLINDKYRGGEFEKAYESWLESIEISLEK